MPNIKSSTKRAKIERVRRVKNKAVKTALRTTIKKFNEAVAGGDREAAANAYKVAVKCVDQATAKGIIHKNNAARKKSKMALKFNAMAQ
ncbi:MAG TPA: 30S ribosomal protein S20 [Clostridiales bacterium]|jgi:small subunit ribosomal protein S20|nr:30S ribosomal protein S20 [Clostridiales bacterium]